MRILPLGNQCFGRFKKILVSPDGDNTYWIEFERDNPMPIERVKDLNEQWKDTEIIITITKLIKNKKTVKRIKLSEKMDAEDEEQEEESWDKDEKLGQAAWDSPFAEADQ